MALNLCPHPLQVLSVTPERSQMGILRKNSPLLISLQNLGGQSSPLLQSYSNGGSAFVSRAVKEKQTQTYGSAETEISETNPSSSKLVLVVGGTGGVGQLIVASLLKRNIKARLLLRDPAKAKSLFGLQDENSLKIWKGDTRNPDDLDSAIFEGVTHVICCTGTTAFPSRRWNGENTPERVDWEGVRNLVSALPETIKRFVLVSSVGVTKFDELPWRLGVFGCDDTANDVWCLIRKTLREPSAKPISVEIAVV
ncbi:uncharacterized protein LOC110112339 [Dendrobium catenatum]|uniref:uncharacterized protein LOC110112339 n=1 Tax=Dendrobium catenatum TaxID=906689 RepID=UPI00109F3B0E|nr:uncharacterized protein LOC110112339 [Dendrobium catenatum]